MLTFEIANRLFGYDKSSGKLHCKVVVGRKRPNEEPGYNYTTKDGNTYRCVVYKYIKYQTHHIVWLLCKGKLPTNQIDHIDGDGLNNRIDNLRDVTNLVNGQNQKKTIRNTSGVMGVHWNKNNCKWQARISINTVRVFLGEFNSKDEAIVVRKQAEIDYGYHPNHGRD